MEFNRQVGALEAELATSLRGMRTPRSCAVFPNLAWSWKCSPSAPVAALVRTVFAQPDHGGAMAQLKKVTGVLAERFPKAADLLADAAEDVLAHLHLPRSTAGACTPPTRSSGCTRR
jgi:hypothetical protein